MMRWLPRLLFGAVVLGLTVWFSLEPGRLTLTWTHMSVDLPLGLAAALIGAVVAVLWLLAWFSASAFAAPARLAQRRRERQRLEGYRLLTDGLVAIAAGNIAVAERMAARADRLFRSGRHQPPPFGRLLAAQAALLRGDGAAARPEFTALLGHERTRLLGLRGLIVEAMAAGDDAGALNLLERAARVEPRARWVQATKLALEAQSGDWRRAGETLDRARRLGALGLDEAQRHRIAILLGRSIAALAEGRRQDALMHAASAYQQDPGFAPAALAYAERLIEAGKAKAARSALERSWSRQAHPDIAELYGRLIAEEPPMARFKLAERFAASRPQAISGRLLAASSALAARLWGEARRHLDAAGMNGPGPFPARLCDLAAELALSEHGDAATAASWRRRAADVPPESRYTCRNCGARPAHWLPLCPVCNRFDTLEWRAETGSGGTVVPQHPEPHVPGLAVPPLPAYPPGSLTALP